MLELDADGVQIYTCEAKGGGFEWSFKAPEANLFDKEGRQVGTHFAGPTWKIDDGSEVVGEVAATADAPDPSAIQWLLLRAKTHQGSWSSVRGLLHSSGGDRGRYSPEHGLRREPCLAAGTHALFRDLPVL